MGGGGGEVALQFLRPQNVIFMAMLAHLYLQNEKFYHFNPEKSSIKLH